MSVLPPNSLPAHITIMSERLGKLVSDYKLQRSMKLSAHGSNREQVCVIALQQGLRCRARGKGHTPQCLVANSLWNTTQGVPNPLCPPQFTGPQKRPKGDKVLKIRCIVRNLSSERWTKLPHHAKGFFFLVCFKHTLKRIASAHPFMSVYSVLRSLRHMLSVMKSRA